MSDGICHRLDMGRGPLQYRTDIERFGIQQRNTKWHLEGESDWYAGWPSYIDRATAEDALRYYRDSDHHNPRPKYEHRICVYPPEPPPFSWRLEFA